MSKLKEAYHFLSPKFQNLFSEYKVEFKPRYGHGLPAHDLLFQIIDKNRTEYEENLQSFLKYNVEFTTFKDQKDETNEDLPAWNNDFLPGLDIVGLYGMVSNLKPKSYIEIGSGNSTKVVRKAIADQGLETVITSIDPFPRANIDHLADKVIREPLENIRDLSFITDQLQKNDIIFIDNSHRCFPNSDVAVCFLELLPRLKNGVIIQIHDIYLPYDYPQFMCDRFYSEQYMLATTILANPAKYKVVLPNYFISEDENIKKILNSLWEKLPVKNVERHGGSFWMQVSE
jgi:hypothetical protein